MDDYNTYRYTNCVQCGDRFKDDCGWDFCSSKCEDQYEEYHKECARCGDEQEDNIFPDGEHCENCIEEMEEEK